jgi:hypothetical protein
MKIVAQTHSRLAMKHLPTENWWTGGLLISFCLGSLIYLIFFNAVSASLTCNRVVNNQINCVLKRFYLLGKTEQQKVFDPQKAIMKTLVGSKGSRNYQVIIATPFGEYSILKPTTGYRYHQAIVSQINNFIVSEQTYLSIRQHQWYECSIYLLMIGVAIIWSAFLISSPVVTCTFYKSLNTIVIEYQGLRGSRIKEYPLFNLLRIDSQEKNTRWGKLYRPALVLKSSETIPIHQDYTNKNINQNAVYSINNFLEY